MRRKPITESIFYVYVHRSALDGRVFYIGKGAGYRVSSTSGRSSAWKLIANLEGYVKQVVASGLSEFDSLELEAFLISEARLSGLQIVNKTSGGQGLSGMIVSGESKMKMRAAKIGKKQSPEHAAKSAMSRKGKKSTPEAIEATMKWRRRPVVASDGTWYESATAAGRAMQEKNGGGTLQANITSCANGKRKTAHGLSWRYEI